MTLAALALPVCVAVFAWWFSTGLILLLVRRPRAEHDALLVGYGGVALGAFAIVISTASRGDAAAAYAAFVCALIIWGWHEASFLMGRVTGPRPLACPPDAVGFARLRYATLTVLHHEIALAGTAGALAFVTWQGPNPVAAWTFLVLFVMRLSAKFNIFLGVPNLSDEFFPPHLEHLKSYLPRRPMSWLMPISVLGSLTLAGWCLIGADHAAAGSAPATGLALMFALTMLALLEHAFMVLPLPDTALWRWAAPRGATGQAVSAALSGPAGMPSGLTGAAPALAPTAPPRRMETAP
jgi:putative photosynthetic complex assembly protein 2